MDRTFLVHRPLKALYTTVFTHSHTHSYSNGGGCHAECQPAHQEQLEVKCLAQGHIGMWTGGTGK